MPVPSLPSRRLLRSSAQAAVTLHSGNDSDERYEYIHPPQRSLFCRVRKNLRHKKREAKERSTRRSNGKTTRHLLIFEAKIDIPFTIELPRATFRTYLNGTAAALIFPDFAVALAAVPATGRNRGDACEAVEGTDVSNFSKCSSFSPTMPRPLRLLHRTATAARFALAHRLSVCLSFSAFATPAANYRLS